MIPGNINTALISGAEGGGYQIQRSLRFNSSDSAFLSRTPASAGNRKTWSLSFWIKFNVNSGNQYIFAASPDGYTSDFHFAYLRSDGTIKWDDVVGGSNVQLNKISNQVFRDFSAWYHFLFVVDTTNGTAANRNRLYVNGSEITWASGNNFTSNADSSISRACVHHIGGLNQSSSYLSAYLADIHFIDGQALTPSSFTEVSATTGQLIPKAYSGSFGTNGFWLKFSDNSAATATTLGKDYSGNNNNWSCNNLSVTAGAGNDSLVDTPSSAGTDTGLGGEVTGNYCTLNPLNRNSNANLSNGNLNFSLASAGVNYGTFATFGVRTGKWYFEASIDSFISYGITTGFVTSDWGRDYIGSGGTAYFGLDTTQGRRSSAGITSSGSTVTYGAGDVVGVAFNADAGTATIYKNGASVYTFSGIPANDYLPALSSGGSSAWINFGQRPFAYTAPSGFKALCDTNLPAPVVAKPNTAFDVVTYTGNGSARSITLPGGFSPDLIWTKSRSTNYFHHLYDIIRGTNSDLSSNSTSAESTGSPYNDGVTAFNSNGYTLGAFNGLNENGTTYVAWAWDAGSSTVTNTQGSITSQVRANASAGFSIVTYTGTGANATVGHGLNVAPSLVIVKRRNSTSNWLVWNSVIAASNAANVLFLDTTDAALANSTNFNSTSPTSTVFTVGTNAATNASGGTHVAYCFSPVTGYSSFGSYTGNGSADGPFVYTGFRPRWIMFKCSSTNNGYTFWDINDAARSDYNSLSRTLCANLSDAEDSANIGTQNIDILSNGFKIRTTGSAKNLSSQTYVFAAFAESPFQYARAR